MSVDPRLDPSRRAGGGSPRLRQIAHPRPGELVPQRPGQPGPPDPSIRRTWWLLAGSFLLLGIVAAARVVFERTALDWLVLIAVGLAAIAAVGHRNAVVRLEAKRRAEAESYARILRGLSRSVSADSIVGAIMDDLVDATGADHVAIIRRRGDGTGLDATLVTGRPGIPPTTTSIPISDLEGPLGPGSGAPPVGVPIEPIRDGEAAAAPAEVRAGTVAAASSDAPEVDAARSPDPSVETNATWHAAPRGGRPRHRAAEARATGGGLAGTVIREAVALVRDLGLPAPDPSRDTSGAAVAEVLSTGVDAAITGRLANRVRAAFGLSQTIAAPIRTEHGLIGAIVLSRRDREPWSDSARRLLFGAARETATALERATTLREAEALASTDPLTGLPNRRYFEEFSGLLARRRRSGDAVAALMIDIDHFKRLNEAYGHPVGDLVLRRVAQSIVQTVREEDVPARVGGEEFAVLLRNPGPTVAAEVGERVRLAVRQLDLRDVGVDAVSVSVGVANARGADEPIPDLVERADQALRKAKRSGRDQVVTAG